jgi:hypothetical protein
VNYQENCRTLKEVELVKAHGDGLDYEQLGFKMAYSASQRTQRCSRRYAGPPMPSLLSLKCCSG